MHAFQNGQIIRFADLRPTRWKNGGGETSELAVHPPDADFEAFDWRISLARMTADGPFSAFPGVDRTLAVADGAGLSLSVGAAPNMELTGSSEPFRFCADETCQARLLAGPVLNFNVMTRRSRFRHAVTRYRLKVATTFAFPHIGVVLCVEGAVAVGGQSLRPRDSLVLRSSASIVLQPEGACEGLVLRADIEPCELNGGSAWSGDAKPREFG